MKKSIHYGLNSVNPAAYGGWPGWLNACVADARELAVLAARAGFTASAVFNEEATVERLRADVASLAGISVAGDTIWLTYSGHGGRSPSSGAWDGYTETLCLYNGELADTAFREMLCQFVPGVRIIVDLDSCFSGGMNRAATRIRSKPGFVRGTVEMPSSSRGTLDAGVMLRSACTSTETASDGEDNGAYTAGLLKMADVAIDGKRDLTWQGWIEATQRYMAKEFPSQHPQVSRYGSELDWNVSVTD